MSRTTELLEQNQDLLDALAPIGIQLRLGSDHNGRVLHRKLTDIVEKLEEHLRAEERELYPELERAREFQIRLVGKSMHRGFQELDQRITRFLARWSDVAKIDKAHDDFTHDAAALVDALRRILHSERANLFPIAERRH
jgi:hemerythrin-like domain-containing protein